MFGHREIEDFDFVASFVSDIVFEVGPGCQVGGCRHNIELRGRNGAEVVLFCGLKTSSRCGVEVVERIIDGASKRGFIGAHSTRWESRKVPDA